MNPNYECNCCPPSTCDACMPQCSSTSYLRIRAERPVQCGHVCSTKNCKIYGGHDTNPMPEYQCLKKRNREKNENVNSLGSPIGLVTSSVNFKHEGKTSDIIRARYATNLKAFARLYLNDEKTWDSLLVDDLMNEGLNLYASSQKNETAEISSSDIYTANEQHILREFELSGFTFHIELMAKFKTNGPTSAEADGATGDGVELTLENVVPALKSFFRQHKYALVTVGSFYATIWRSSDVYFLFDACGRRVADFKSDRNKGVAMLMCLRSLENIRHLVVNLSGLQATDPLIIRELKVVKVVTPNSVVMKLDYALRTPQYEVINDDYAYLKSNLHLTLNKRDLLRNRSGLPVAVAAIVASKIDHPATWDMKMLDKIICFGVNFCQSCWLKCKAAEGIDVNEFPPYFNLGQFYVNVELESGKYQGTWRCVPGFEHSELAAALKSAFDAKHYKLILQINNQIYAIWKKHDFIYLLDPYRHRILGKPNESEVYEEMEKSASLRMFRSFDVFMNVLNHILLDSNRTSPFFIHHIKVKNIQPRHKEKKEVSARTIAEPQLDANDEILSLNEHICFEEAENLCQEALGEISDYEDEALRSDVDEMELKTSSSEAELMEEEQEGGPGEEIEGLETSSSGEEGGGHKKPSQGGKGGGKGSARKQKGGKKSGTDTRKTKKGKGGANDSEVDYDTKTNEGGENTDKREKTIKRKRKKQKTDNKKKRSDKTATSDENNTDLDTNKVENEPKQKKSKREKRYRKKKQKEIDDLKVKEDSQREEKTKDDSSKKDKPKNLNVAKDQNKDRGVSKDKNQDQGKGVSQGKDRSKVEDLDKDTDRSKDKDKSKNKDKSNIKDSSKNQDISKDKDPNKVQDPTKEKDLDKDKDRSKDHTKKKDIRKDKDENKDQDPSKGKGKSLDKDKEQSKDLNKNKDINKDQDPSKEKDLDKHKDLTKDKDIRKGKDLDKGKDISKDKDGEKGQDPSKEEDLDKDKDISKDKDGEKGQDPSKEEDLDKDKAISKDKDLIKDGDSSKDNYPGNDKDFLKDKYLYPSRDRGRRRDKIPSKDKEKKKFDQENKDYDKITNLDTTENEDPDLSLDKTNLLEQSEKVDEKEEVSIVESEIIPDENDIKNKEMEYSSNKENEFNAELNKILEKDTTIEIEIETSKSDDKTDTIEDKDRRRKPYCPQLCKDDQEADDENEDYFKKKPLPPTCSIPRPNCYPGYFKSAVDMAVVGSESGSYESICRLFQAGFKVADRLLTLTPWGNFVIFLCGGKKTAEKKLYYLFDGCTCNFDRFRHLDLTVGTAGLISFEHMHNVIAYIRHLRKSRRQLHIEPTQCTADEICKEYCNRNFSLVL